ncbi:KH domain-containing protein [Aerococcaceae bacterium zg-ZJ1578]|uniref:KH domain-containing protein n=1 Tax=Aerococcaceae TaxID=186827 RepID=UPI0013B5BEE1|nr:MULTISPECIES: KH domain-containing protein [unclassified Facklamia]MBK0348122.1 KH domain-containing protein [Aerococcaceae bacterium zg-1578]MBR7927336.1 KH domain-containing protein [Aerococcaceae bacterium zg-ZUI334]QQD65776.1 KH domain-containing protein [Aerococcaceae bacterium zg-252]NEW64067.1 KH domain-containing protein [Facklamia sp. 252]NEW67524.1 KH domain-containing protein [Facklamia sp. 253]
MANIKQLINTIVEPLIEFPEDMRIEEVDTDEFYEYHLHLNKEDIGRVIGKKGRVARAIRTIVYSVRTNNRKRTRLVIVDEDNNNLSEE